MLKKFVTTVFLILLSLRLIFEFSSTEHTVFADSDSGKEWAEKIKDLEKEIEVLQSQNKTLQTEITYYDSQINLTNLLIQNAISEINKRTNILTDLKNDIEELVSRIEKMGDSINYQQIVLNERVRERYKSQNLHPTLFLLSSDSFSEAIRKAKYLKTLQYKDQLVLEDMKRAKDAYNQQRDLFEDKRDQTEELKQNVENEKANLITYQANLDIQRAAKQNLLKQTQNDENRFQKMLEDARRELSQIIGAASALQGTEPKDVDEGDIIGIQGNTGYSFGDHLHFGVYKYNSIDDIAGWDWYNSNSVDPENVLEKKRVYWNTGCSESKYKDFGKGDWEWPISSPIISQDYGHTCYSDTYYGGKDHPALDMYGSVGEPILAVADGKAYFCRNCLGDGGNGVFIFHDKYMTLYWHLQ